jgi:arylsulfatase A-like enzyme
VRNIDLAPTISQILGVQPAATVQGRSLLRRLRFR